MATEHTVMSLVVASGNRGKLAEFRAMLAGMPVEVLAMSEVVSPPSVREDQDTFARNALQKARAVAEVCQLVTLADDSGLEVDALGGRPGVRSARFAGEGATDAANNAALLAQLEHVDDEARTARFRCAIVLVDPWSPEAERELVVEGTCEGRIARKPSGTGGFGYDPLFIAAEIGCTMADMSGEQKNRVSHRGRALAKLRPKLTALIEARLAHAAQVMSGKQPVGV
jgi:XTP/dITP diphosphohydrolase